MAKKDNNGKEVAATISSNVVAFCDQSVAVRQIEKMIFTIRGVQVMLDSDLAMLYSKGAGEAQYKSFSGRFYVPTHVG